jgi:cysteine desulfurase
VTRVYLDWNATAPLRPQAREAMLAAMDAVGNPSSVHTEGRAAKAIIERARGQVAWLVGCEPDEVVFTSGATEAMALAGAQFARLEAAPIEHDCVCAYASSELAVSADGHVQQPAPKGSDTLVAIQAANGETGIVQPLHLWDDSTNNLVDAAQVLGKMAFRLGDVNWACCLIAPQKFGGPRGAGSLVVKSGLDVQPLLKGGGQEMRRRSGTENLVGIAGFGAAAEAARRDLEAGVWEPVAKLRDDLEARLEDAVPGLVIVGRDVPRLPNTSYFAVPGWRGETQVMQMDLAGFAVSAGSACSSGKVGASRVLLAMGFDEETAASAIRVSMGPTTAQAEVTAFADTWIEHYRRRKARAA